LTYPSPQNEKELFNLRHASLRNIIERIFGAMKRRWRILQLPPEYAMDIQARLPMALCALHNFIHHCDASGPDTIDQDFLDGDLPDPIFTDDDMGDDARGELTDGPADAAERRRADNCCDEIAAAMWADYVEERTCRGLAIPAPM